MKNTFLSNQKTKDYYNERIVKPKTNHIKCSLRRDLRHLQNAPHLWKRSSKM